MVSTHPLIFKFPHLFINPLVTVSSAPITIGITVNFMFYCFFQFSSKVEVLIFLFAFFQFSSVFSRDRKVHYSAGSLYVCVCVCVCVCACVCVCVCWLSRGLIVWPRLGNPFLSQNPRNVCASHSPGQILGCAYTICLHGQI